MAAQMAANKAYYHVVFWLYIIEKLWYGFWQKDFKNFNLCV